MKASILAFYLSVLAPLIAGSAIPETQGHPDYVSESPYPAPVLEDRSVETLEKRRVHWVRLCMLPPGPQIQLSTFPTNGE
jgi:hypothetical protein